MTIPTEDHIAALREIIVAAKTGNEERLAHAFANAELLLDGGQKDEDGERTLSAMEQGIGGGDDVQTMVGSTDDGFVILRFSRLVQWIRYDPPSMLAITEALIAAAQGASTIWMPPKKKFLLPGLGGD
jgi:hypothetical protein